MKVLVVLLLVLGVVRSAKILAFFYYPSISHQFVFQPIVKELSLRGHEVTYVSPNAINDPRLTNLTEVDISVGYEIFKKTQATVFNRETTGVFKFGLIGVKFMQYILSMQMEVEGVKDILKKPEGSYDLILIEAMNPILHGLQHKFQAPLIAVSSFGLQAYLHQCFGNPIQPSLYPEMFSGYLSPITDIFEKLDSLYVYSVFHVMSELYMFPTFDKIARGYFGNDMPFLKDLVKDTSLVFTNINPIFSEKRPLAPNVVEVWNIHLNNQTKMDKDLQKILDEAKNGVVYFSLGTNVRFDHVQGDVKEAILQALGELPFTVLCKWESEDFPGKPKNVILRKWLPQQSILAHKNIKVFVTQGGLQSSEEAISNGVPMVVIPFLADQPMNAKILTKHGIAETILPKVLEKDILRDTILKVSKDEKYRLKAQELRSIFLDQPQTGLEKIVWWCEYVIRHKGAKHLRSPGADISLFEYFMLDILGIALVVLFVSYKVISMLVRLLLCRLRGCKKTGERKKNN